LADGGISRFDPPIVPFNGSRSGWLGIAPGEPKVGRERFDREIVGGPFSFGEDHIIVEIDGLGWIEEPLELRFGADAGIPFAELSPNSAFVLGIE
jgi:hypothetical protein